MMRFTAEWRGYPDPAAAAGARVAAAAASTASAAWPCAERLSPTRWRRWGNPPAVPGCPGGSRGWA